MVHNMEIERKYLTIAPPGQLEQYSSHMIEQAYLCISPVIRIRRSDDDYYLTYKGEGLMAREEYNLPLSKEAYDHLMKKADGHVLSKRRYLIPLEDDLTAELDVFEGMWEGLIITEVEFPDLETADSYSAPGWFGREVTTDGHFHNSWLSRHTPEELKEGGFTIDRTEIEPV